MAKTFVLVDLETNWTSSSADWSGDFGDAVTMVRELEISVHALMMDEDFGRKKKGREVIGYSRVRRKRSL